MNARKKMKNCLLMATVCLLLPSCSMIPMAFPPDLSKHELYKPYVGRTVYLRNDGYTLYKANGSFFENYIITSSTLDEGDRIAKLKQGTALYIEKVKKVRPGGLPDTVYVIGSIDIRGKKYRYEMNDTDYADIYKYPSSFLLNKP